MTVSPAHLFSSPQETTSIVTVALGVWWGVPFALRRICMEVKDCFSLRKNQRQTNWGSMYKNVWISCKDPLRALFSASSFIFAGIGPADVKTKLNWPPVNLPNVGTTEVALASFSTPGKWTNCVGKIFYFRSVSFILPWVVHRIEEHVHDCSICRAGCILSQIVQFETTVVVFELMYPSGRISFWNVWFFLVAAR